MQLTPFRSRGFSLMELMVVIAIIGILASIITPSSLLVRRKAQEAVTIGQIRNILTAFSVYSSDHDDFYPGAMSTQIDENGDEEKVSWLAPDGSIFRQLYPNGNAGSPIWDDGNHLHKTVFINGQSLKSRPDEKNLYNHTFCLNGSLVTDAIGQQSDEPRFSKRNRFLYESETETMLIIEADQAGNFNSVTFDEIARVEDAYERNYDRFVFAGYMDGSADKLKKAELPDALDANQACYFWTGMNLESYLAYQKQADPLDRARAMERVYRAK